MTDARLEKLRWWVESKVRKVIEVWTIGGLDRESDQSDVEIIT